MRIEFVCITREGVSTISRWLSATTAPVLDGKSADPGGGRSRLKIAAVRQDDDRCDRVRVDAKIDNLPGASLRSTPG
jgi:hypothetical protein